MASRCAPNPRIFLPFLYPSVFAANGAGLSRPRFAAVVAAAGSGPRRSNSSSATDTDATTPDTNSRLNPSPDDYSMPYFADQAQLTVYAGHGGNGCISFLREAYLEDGPPNGGDGGHGGNVYIQATHAETSLHKLARRRFVRAGRGKHGQGSARSGPRGDDVVISVPVGTVVTEISRDDPNEDAVFYDRPLTIKEKRRKRRQETEEPEPDLDEHGDPVEHPNLHKFLLYPGISSSERKRIQLPPLPRRDRLFVQPRPGLHLDLSRPTPRPILLAAGGLGGLGNPHFASKERKKPMFATKGEPAMSMQIQLELKLLADVGLVGLPNAGKSTLLRAISNSRARVGNWAFTTLQPNIGTVVLDNNKGRPTVTSFRKPAESAPIDPYDVNPVDLEADMEPKQRTRFTVADIPGLIEGAHLDKGLGIAFLRHVERAGVLAFVIDLGAGNAVAALKSLWNEVGLYAQMREEEERDRERASRIDWTAETSNTDDYWPAAKAFEELPENSTGLHIAAKPWFVVATKGDLPNTQENFRELREYLAAVTNGTEPHPSGVDGAWTENIAAIPVSAINGHGRGGGNRSGGHRPYQTYPEVKKENERLERFYNGLLNDLADDERADFWAALRRELPNSFRFCGSKGHALAVKRLLQTRYIPQITSITHDGVVVAPPQAVPWYPDSLAWSMTTPKNVIRKFPPFADFQKFLVSETSVGNISRQEVVSMIPPLLMDLRPGMTVLDLCAAPGSKAAQLLEMIHRGEEARIRSVVRTFGDNGGVKSEDKQEEEAAQLEADPSDDGRATGMLIANDADYKRGHMLVHQLKRLSSPNMIVTNHDATMYPALRVPNPTDPNKPSYLKFDRILADVPCSGDGTLRKNVNLWKDWNPGSALGLHLTQMRILVRALQMLKPGGRMVYSTCSMNPVENESVVAAAIERCGGPDKIEIVDCSDRLPELKRKPGLRKWQIMDKTGSVWNTWKEVEDYVKSTEDGINPSRLVDTMFPRPEDSNCSDLPLERCMRVYAHQQDTGGFFITVLQKKAEFKAKPEPKQGTNGVSNGVKRPLEPEDAEEEAAVKKVKTDDEAEPESPAEVAIAEATSKSVIEAVAETAADLTAEITPEEKSEEKTEEEMPEPVEEDMVEVKEEDTNAATPVDVPAQPEKRKRQEGPYEEPFKFLSPDHEVIKNVNEFYKISSRFPSDRYMVRNALGEPAKAIYYTSQLVRDILVCNEGRGVKFIHGGVKMFVKQDAPSADVCRWRIQSEGMPILHGYVGEERVVVLKSKDTLKRLLIEMFPKISGDEWQKLNEIGERVRDLALGCCVLRVEPEGGDPDFSETMALPLWKSFQSLNLMLPKEDRTAMLLRIYNDKTPLINMGIKKEDAKKEDEAEVKDEVKGEADADADAGADGDVKMEGADEAVKPEDETPIKVKDQEDSKADVEIQL
ncbi:mitochondrial GTPase [Naviculisporaceae sp. PSN 640]